MSDSDKQALLSGEASIPYKITILGDTEEDNIELTEDDIVSTTYEDYRYVDTATICIGQFVARTISGTLVNPEENMIIEDKEIKVELGIKTNESTTYYSLGNFLITVPENNTVKDKTSFEAMDYTKKFNKEFDASGITFPCTAMELAQYCCEQCGVELGTTNFENDGFIVPNNQYEPGDTYRKVMQDIGKLAYSWVRIDWDNKCYLDFDIPSSTIDQYNDITPYDYYDLTIQDEVFGPVNRVVIGMSDVEGENAYIEDADSIEKNGVFELQIMDNNITYTPELRQQAILGASRLFGLTYQPVEINTTGHPWLLGKELIRIEKLDGTTITTIPFDRTIEYGGHIKTNLTSSADTRVETEYKNPGDLENTMRQTRIIVDKQNQTINSIVSQTEGNTSQISQMQQTIDSIQNMFQITGGDNDIKNSVGLFENDYWENSETGEFFRGYDADLITDTISSSKIGVKNGKTNTTVDNIVNLATTEIRTLSFKVINDANTTTTIRLRGNTTLVEKTIDYECHLEEFSFQYTPDSPNLVLEIESETDHDGWGYVTDLMSNIGEATTWEPAKDEIVGTVLKLSRQGLTVYCTGSDIATLMSSQGFQIRRFQNNELYEIITEFTDKGIVTKDISCNSIKVKTMMTDVINVDGNDTVIMYIRSE